MTNQWLRPKFRGKFQEASGRVLCAAHLPVLVFDGQVVLNTEETFSGIEFKKHKCPEVNFNCELCAGMSVNTRRTKAFVEKKNMFIVGSCWISDEKYGRNYGAYGYNAVWGEVEIIQVQRAGSTSLDLCQTSNSHVQKIVNHNDFKPPYKYTPEPQNG